MMRKAFRLKKQSFTLLELLLVLFIISFGMALTGVKVKELYQQQRFFSETQMIISHLTMAQDLMLILDTDVKVKIRADEKGDHLEMWLEVMKPLKKPWQKFVERKIQFSAIKSVFFAEQGNEILLNFSFGKMSQGILTLSESPSGETDKKYRRSQINLLGFPGPITTKAVDDKEKEKVEKSQLLYPVEVYEKLYTNAQNQKIT